MNRKSNKNDTGWGKVADWYKGVVTDSDSYQTKVILPNLLRIMEIKKDERILDIGCGTGYFSKAFIEKGAHVVGCDIGRELLDIARKENPKAEFHLASAEKLIFSKDHTFNKATIVLALQNINNYQIALKEASRVLIPGGKLFIVLNHPAFRIPQKSDWGFDEQKKIQYRRLDGYMSESRVGIVMHPGQKKSEITPSFHRPLQSYFKALTSAGFSSTRLEEWISHKASQRGPRQIAEDLARKEFPLFLAIEATKTTN